MDSVPIGHHYHQQHHHHQVADHNKGMMSSSSYSVWNEFFLLAGIPSSVANEYAVTFSQHRIRIDMLKEITKEILIDMGIKAMGDIIAILRHAKNLYTQDELKSGIRATTTTAGSVGSSITSPRQTMVNNNNNNNNDHYQKQKQQHNLAQRMPITTSRPAERSSVSSLVGTKIQSRVSLNSGALMASTNNSSSSHQPLQGGKRAASAANSGSIAKRLRPAADLTTERTLTVYYPSSSAIAKAQQRIMPSNGGSVIAQQQQPHVSSTSIKSRLGTNASLSGRQRNSESSPINNFNGRGGRPKGSNNDSAVAGRSTLKSTDSPSSNWRSESGRSVHVKREGLKQNRLKSTVFNRLGNGAR